MGGSLYKNSAACQRQLQATRFGLHLAPWCTESEQMAGNTERDDDALLVFVVIKNPTDAIDAATIQWEDADLLLPRLQRVG